MKPIEVVALKNAINGNYESAREKVKPGQYVVNFTVTVSGTLNVGENYIRADSLADPWALLKLAVNKLGQAEFDKLINYANKNEIDTEVVKRYVKERSKHKNINSKGKVNCVLFVKG